jgi:hypothetical protein
MVTKNFSTQAAAFLAVPRERTSTWAAPVQGIDMSTPASRLGSIAGVTTATVMATANAAKGAARKDAAGGTAFEDPV